MYPYHYSFTGLVELPAFGKYASGGRSAVHGHIGVPHPITEDQLKTVITKEEAKKFGCDPDGITFVRFTYTEIPN